MAIEQFAVPTADTYIKEAVGAAAYINTRKKVTEHGTVWDVRDAWTGKEVWNDEISLYTGSAGIIHFFLQLYDVTGDISYLEDSKSAGQYLVWRWRHKPELTKCFSKWAYTTGYAGVGSVLLELYSYDPDKAYLDTVAAIAEAAMRDARKPEDGVGYYWSTYPGIVGDGGTILFLLETARKLGREDIRQFAIQAGRFYVNKGERVSSGGTYYRGVDPAFFGYPEDYKDPNFPMGTAGIGYLLLTLYEESKDPIFLAAEKEIPDFLYGVAVGVRTPKAMLIPHALPYRKNLFYLSYCHGPAGTSRYFYKKYQITQDKHFLDWAERLAEGVIAAGAPEIHSEGYWLIHCYCCGTAGILNLFLGLYAATGKEKYLEYARRCGKQLLGWASHEETESGVITKWYTAFDRVNPHVITSPIGYYDGVAGIGAMLLQMASAEKRAFRAVRSVDDPFPAEI